MPLDFILDRFFDKLKRVDVFEFHFGPEGFLTGRSQGEIRFAAQTAFFHVTVADIQIDEDIPQRLEVGYHLVGRPHIGLGHNFQERRARPVQIHPAASGSGLMRLVRRGAGHCGSRKKKLAVCLYSTVTLFARFLG